jgi:hypothetical protein
MSDAAATRNPLRLASTRRIVIEGAVVVATLGLALAAFFHRGEPLADGMVARATFSLIAPDTSSAECAADLDYEDFQCGYDGQNRRQTGPRRVVIPLNGNRGLMLLDGFLDQAEIAERVAQEPAGQSRKAYKSFLAECKVRVLTRIPRVKARWRRGRWATSDHVWLAEVLHCSVGE